MQILRLLDLELVCCIHPHHLSERVSLAQLEDNEIFHSPTLRRGVKWGRVLCPPHATQRQWNLFALSVVEWHENWQNKYAEGTTEERWGYLAPTISHLFPFFISHQHKECFGRGQNQLWAGTGHTNWFTALGQKCVAWKELRSTCLKKYKLFIYCLPSSPSHGALDVGCLRDAYVYQKCF